jgi:hypothetical protein
MSEYYKKYIKYKNKYLNLQTQMGGVLGDELLDEPPPVVRKGNPSYSYDRDAIYKAREIAEAEARIANRNYEDKIGLFKQAVKDMVDFKKDRQNKAYRESNHRWPYPEIVEQRIKDFNITRRGGEPNHYWYDRTLELEVERLAEVLFRIAEYKESRELQKIRDIRIAMNKPVRDSPHRWPYPSIVRQIEEDENLVYANKELLKATKDYLEKYNLYPTELIDNMYKLRKTVESRPYVLHWMEETAKKMYGEDGRGRKDDLNYKEDFMY